MLLAGLKPYPAMRDSGVEGLGEVPEHWGVRRLRTLSRHPIRNGIGESAQPYREDWPRYVRITDIADPRSLRASTTASLPPAVALPALLEPGDILLAAVGATYGKSYLYDGACGPACFAGYLVRLAPNGDVLPEFISYWSESSGYWNQVHSRVIKATIENFSASRYKRLVSPIPPIEEQVAIVRFLDYADRRVRRYIRAKEELIQLLEEQKHAIIQEAVRGQIDVRTGQPYPAYKDSGMEWFEEVPEHWECVPLCGVANSKSVIGKPHRELLSVYLNRGVIRFSDADERRANPTSLDLSSYQAVDPGDLVLNNQQAWRGSVGVSALSGIVSPAYLVLALSPRLHRGFADFLFRSRSMVSQYRVSSRGVGSIQRNLYWPHVRRAVLAVPPLSEQMAISRFLERVTGETDSAVSNVQREIDLVREYRTRLIADVVAGKLDVRQTGISTSDVGPPAEDAYIRVPAMNTPKTEPRVPAP